jgi:hypothetical protein
MFKFKILAQTAFSLLCCQVGYGKGQDMVVSREKIVTHLVNTGQFQTIKDWNIIFSYLEENEPQNVKIDFNSEYVDLDRDGRISERDQGFFNPASTVKTAIAGLVLEELKENNFALSDRYGQMRGERTTFGDDLRLMQLLSDNDATNRLILFLGFDAINERMKAKGYSVFTVERLMMGQGTLVPSPPLEVYSQGRVIHRPGKPTNWKSRCEEASGKSGNCASQHELIKIMGSIINKGTNPESFDIRDGDRAWLSDVMSKTPREFGFDYPDDWNRFIQSKKEELVGESGKLFSKGGVALWSKTWTDSSYLVTEDHRRITLVITVRPPEEVTQAQAFPFMANLALSLKKLASEYL